MSNKIVSVIIVAAGNKEYFLPLIDSIKKQTYPEIEIIVVYNPVNAGFSQQIYADYPDITLYASPKNLYYCQALNKGIELSRGDFLLCLNDDVILDKMFIGEALRGFSIDKKIGMVSGKILRANGKTIDSTGLFLSHLRTAKERGYGLCDTGKFEKEGYIFGVNGAVAFYRKEMLEQTKIGLEYFDPDFRIFYEDLDIAWRAQNFGWRGYYTPKAIAYHIRGGTVRANKGINKRCARHYLDEESTIDLIKNRYLTIVKNDTLSNFLLHLPAIIIYDLCAYAYIFIFRFSLLKKMPCLPGLVKTALKKRRVLNNSRKSLSTIT